MTSFFLHEAIFRGGWRLQGFSRCNRHSTKVVLGCTLQIKQNHLLLAEDLPEQFWRGAVSAEVSE